MSEGAEVPIRPIEKKGPTLKNKVLRGAGALVVAGISTYGALTDTKSAYAEGSPDSRPATGASSTAPLTATDAIDKEAQRIVALTKEQAEARAEADVAMARAKQVIADAAKKPTAKESPPQTSPVKKNEQNKKSGKQQNSFPTLPLVAGGIISAGVATGVAIKRRKGIFEWFKGIFNKESSSEPSANTSNPILSTDTTVNSENSNSIQSQRRTKRRRTPQPPVNSPAPSVLPAESSEQKASRPAVPVSPPAPK